MTAALTLALVGGVAFVFLFGRYNVASALKGWETILTPAGRQALAGLEEHVALDEMLAGRAHAKALKARLRAQSDEAARLLGVAAGVIEEAVPDRLTRLKGMAVCCRMAAAILPLPKVLPRHFRLREIASLAGIAGWLQHLLVSLEERFRFRLWMLGIFYRLVRRSVGRSRRGIRVPGDSSAAWDAFDQALADFRTLDREHVDCFRTLLVALAAEPSEPGQPSAVGALGR